MCQAVLSFWGIPSLLLLLNLLLLYQQCGINPVWDVGANPPLNTLSPAAGILKVWGPRSQ